MEPTHTTQMLATLDEEHRRLIAMANEATMLRAATKRPSLQTVCTSIAESARTEARKLHLLRLSLQINSHTQEC